MAYNSSKDPKRGKGEDSEMFTCLSPKSILSCWIWTKKSKSQRAYMNEKIKKDREEKGGRVFDDGERKIESAALEPSYPESCQSCAPAADSSGIVKDVTFFNLGIGIGLVYLLAESKDELKKIKDLHKEMEFGIESLKERLAGKDDAQSKGLGSFEEVESSLCLKDPKIRSFIMSRQQSRRKMNLLEEELEAELEHLQLHIDSETMLFQQENYSEIMVEDTVAEGSLYTTNYSEIIDPPPPPPPVIQNEEQYGVCPYELESRLHEVLEGRQQERINELEEALRFSMEKVEEKERELSWWKDTAKLFFEHVPGHHERRLLTHH